MLILPPAPDVAVRVKSTIDPLLPLEALPDFIVRLPLVPLVSASAVRTLNDPLLAYLPYPELIDTEPPVISVLSPAFTTIRPPETPLPLPTAMLILPPTPDVADPVVRTIDPLLPLVADPDFSDRAPLVPLDPPSADRRVNAPLLVAVPTPVLNETLPPVSLELPPA